MLHNVNVTDRAEIRSAWHYLPPDLQRIVKRRTAKAAPITDLDRELLRQVFPGRKK